MKTNLVLKKKKEEGIKFIRLIVETREIIISQLIFRTQLRLFFFFFEDR